MPTSASTSIPTPASTPHVELQTHRQSPPAFGVPTDLEQLGERIAALSGQIAAATAQLLTLIREFDEREGWNTGFLSCAHWLSWRTGLAPGPAREKVRVARALATLPRIADALRRGALSYSKVRGTDAGGHPGHRIEAARFRHGWHHDPGRTARAWLAPVDRTLDQEQAAEAGVGPAQRRADALGRVADAALVGGLDRGRGATGIRWWCMSMRRGFRRTTRPGVSVLEGRRVPAGTSRRIACDASRVVMTHDARGRVLDVGRKHRVIPPTLRRALAHRDTTCQFPGCDRTCCDAHHLRHWADGGETGLANLVLLCRRHHRSVHEEGYRVTGGWRWTRPDGPSLPEVPHTPRSRAGGRALARVWPSAVMAIGHSPATLPRPEWDGRPLDIGWAIDVLYRPLGPEP